MFEQHMWSRPGSKHHEDVFVACFDREFHPLGDDAETIDKWRRLGVTCLDDYVRVTGLPHEEVEKTLLELESGQ